MEQHLLLQKNLNSLRAEKVKENQRVLNDRFDSYRGFMQTKMVQKDSKIKALKSQRQNQINFYQT